jgi:hypothetical protein
MATNIIALNPRSRKLGFDMFNLRISAGFVASELHV